jgi:hypothetical protein
MFTPCGSSGSIGFDLIFRLLIVGQHLGFVRSDSSPLGQHLDFHDLATSLGPKTLADSRK